MSGFIKEENGSVMAIVAIFLLVAVAFTALAVDGGYLYLRDTQMQDIGDAAALAAAVPLAETSGNITQKKRQAFSQAVDYVRKNGVTVDNVNISRYTANIENTTGERGTMTVTFPSGSGGSRQVQVDLQLESNLYFAKIFGTTQTAVKSSSVAIAGGASEQTGGIVPIAIADTGAPGLEDDFVVGSVYEMNLDPHGNLQGNFGWLSLGSDPNMFGEYMENGYSGSLAVGDQEDVKNGASVGIVGAAIDGRTGRCTESFSEPYLESDVRAHLVEDPECPRLVYTPVVDSLSGNSTTIEGFAAFFIFDYVQSTKTIVGMFIGVVSPSEISNSSSGTVYAVRLIQ